MRTETEEPAPSPLTSLRHRWPLAVALGLIFAVLGFVGGGLLPSTTTAETRLAVGPGDMSAGAIAGFPEATQSMAESYARWVTSNSAAGHGGATVSASPIPESNVIRIEAEDRDPETAVQAADAAAQALMKQVNEGRESTNPDATLKTIDDISTKWSAAKTELERTTWEFDKVNQSTSSTDRQYDVAAAALTKAQAQETYLKTQLDAQNEKYKRQIGEASQAADLRAVEPAHVSANSASSMKQRLAVLGLATGILLALVIAVMSDRRRARRARTA